MPGPKIVTEENNDEDQVLASLKEEQKNKVFCLLPFSLFLRFYLLDSIDSSRWFRIWNQKWSCSLGVFRFWHGNVRKCNLCTWSDLFQDDAPVVEDVNDGDEDEDDDDDDDDVEGGTSICFCLLEIYFLTSFWFSFYCFCRIVYLVKWFGL